MNAEKLFKQATRDKRKLFVIVLGVLIILNWNRISTSFSIGYISGFQGLQPEFNSVYFKGYWYTASTRGPNENYRIGGVSQTASAAEFFDHINLDPDESDRYLPNLHVQQNYIALDEDYGKVTYGPWSVKTGESTETVTNATGTYQVTTETYIQFQMDKYRCEWQFNVYLDGTWGEATLDPIAHKWLDTEIWVKLVPKAWVYFADNPDQVFFAPAKIQCSSLEWGDSSITQYQSIEPTTGSSLGIFYARGGSDEAASDSDLLSYQGVSLDPDIFRSEYWVRISLNQFQPYAWGYLGQVQGQKFPSVTLTFTVYIFVVGEWTVKLTKGETVSLTPHETQTFLDWLSSLVDAWNTFWSNPFNLAGLGAFGITAIAVVAVIVLVFFFGTGWLKRLLWRERRQ